MGAAAGKTEGDTHTHKQRKGAAKKIKRKLQAAKKIRLFQGVGGGG